MTYAFPIKCLAVLAVLVPAAAVEAGDRSQLIAGTRLDASVAQAMSLDEIVAIKNRRDNPGEYAAPTRRGPGVRFDAARHGQLAAGAGLSAAEAEGMSLDEIYQRKINRESNGEDRQRIVPH